MDYFNGLESVKVSLTAAPIFSARIVTKFIVDFEDLREKKFTSKAVKVEIWKLNPWIFVHFWRDLSMEMLLMILIMMNWPPLPSNWGKFHLNLRKKFLMNVIQFVFHLENFKFQSLSWKYYRNVDYWKIPKYSDSSLPLKSHHRFGVYCDCRYYP